MKLELDKSHWIRVTLGDVASSSKEKVDPASGDVERYIAGEHMDSDQLRLARWGDVSEVDLGPAFHRRFRPGQVLYGSRRTYLRKVAVADFEGVCANTTFVIESKDKRVLLQEFLPFVLTSERFHAFAIAESKGSVNPYVNWSDIARYEFSLPPLDEQKRLVDLLWAVETCRRHEERCLSSTVHARSALRDSLVDRMVTGDTIPFSETWSRSPESGWSAAPVDQETGWFVLSLSAIGPEGYRPGQLKSIPHSLKATSTRLSQGDLLISRANTMDAVGRVARFEEDRDDVSFPDTMMRVSLVDDVLTEFAALVLSSAHGRRQMRRTAAGSATSMVKINRKSLGGFAFPKVDLRAQEWAVAHVNRLDEGVQLQENVTMAARRLQRRLLDEVFGDD